MSSFQITEEIKLHRCSFSKGLNYSEYSSQQAAVSSMVRRYYFLGECFHFRTGIGVVGILGEFGVKVIERFTFPALLLEQYATRVTRAKYARIGFDRAVQANFRSIKISELHLTLRQIVESAAIGRIECRSAA
jgi:hypothetical protein